MFKIYKKKVKQLKKKGIRLKSILISKILANSIGKSIDYNKYLIIAGSGRSGTTWLAELLNNIPNSVLIFEPLNIDANPKLDNSEFNVNKYLDPGEVSQVDYNFFENLFRLSFLCKWDTKFISIFDVFKVDYYIIKFIRANLIINWLSEKFPIKKPIFIIRHPCAVVSSLLKFKWGNDKINKINLPFPFFRDIDHNQLTQEEKLALSWCEDNYVPLSTNNSFIVVSFEGLVVYPEKELNRIFELWNIPVPKDIMKKLNIPSQTYFSKNNNNNMNDKKINSTEILTKWKIQLEKGQIEKILKIVNKSGMNFYTDALEPDYNRLYGKNPLNL